MSRRVDHQIVIIGSGFSGIGMGVALRRERRDFLMLERAPEIGGTWRDARYPGCTCTTPAPLHAYSFEPNPYWSRSYVGADEIQDYLLYCVEKYELRGRIRCNAAVRQAQFDEGLGRWHLAVGAPDGSVSTITAASLVVAVGVCTLPVLPDIPGVERFAGDLVHTAAWDPSVTTFGKRVGVIGTGCSAVQLIPPLAQDAEHLTIFQRTAPWVLPQVDPVYPEALVDAYERLPALMSVRRAATRAGLGLGASRPRLAAAVAMQHLRRAVRDPDLRDLLTPDPSCRRVVRSNTYYAALTRADVTLTTAAVAGATEHGLMAADGCHHELDVLAMATGFDTANPFQHLDVHGARGHELAADWGAGVTAYLGVTVPHFPNLFLLHPPGPDAGSGPAAVEPQITLVCRLLGERDRRGSSVVAVRPEVAAAAPACLGAARAEMVDYEFTGAI